MEVKFPSVIYAIRCTQNGRVYIGRTQNFERRMREHLNELKKARVGNPSPKAKHFQDDFDKYGEFGFEVYVLEENVPPELASMREAHWIEEYKATDPNRGYNKLSGKAGRGFSCIKKGKPPKIGEKPEQPKTVYEKFELLTKEHQELVASVIASLLAGQEA